MYRKPEIESFRGDAVVESLGPVSCGSGQVRPDDLGVSKRPREPFER